MRLRTLAAAGAAAAIVAAPAVARPVLTLQVNVTFAKSTCTLQLTSVSRRNTRIVFHIINNSAAPAGFIVYGVKSRFATENGGESTLVVQFRGPGHYAYTCVHGSYQHPARVAKGVFTIRTR